MSHVLLVNDQDQPIGTAEKLAAHQQGWLHRAFSIFIMRRHQGQKEILLQQRALTKYHCGGLWTNSCCSHPKQHQTLTQSGAQRLQEELGFTTSLIAVGSFIYRAALGNGLIEHEFDHVLMGWYQNQIIQPNPEEVADTRWITPNALVKDLHDNPDVYTPWLGQALKVLLTPRTSSR